MAKYRTKSEIVDVFRIGYDWYPSWFEGIISIDQPSTSVRLMTTNREKISLQKGDYVIKNNRDEITYCKEEVFDLLYSKVGVRVGSLLRFIPGKFNAAIEYLLSLSSVKTEIEILDQIYEDERGKKERKEYKKYSVSLNSSEINENDCLMEFNELDKIIELYPLVVDEENVSFKINTILFDLIILGYIERTAAYEPGQNYYFYDKNQTYGGTSSSN